MTNLTAQLIDLAVQIQQIPAPTFSEGQRAEFTRDLFLKENLKDVSMDSLGNVYARLPGKQKKAKPLIISAHLDTVFPISISLQVKKEAGRIVAPGIGDNSMGVAALFGILWSLRERNINLSHDIWFVANVGEEGLGDLRGMRAVVERFQRECDRLSCFGRAGARACVSPRDRCAALSYFGQNCGRTFLV